MPSKDVLELSTLDDCWALLSAKYGQSMSGANDAKYLVTLAHQGFAIAEALVQAQRLEEALDALNRKRPEAGLVAPDSVGVEAIDLLRDATIPVNEEYGAQRFELKHAVAPVLKELNRLGVKGRRRARLSHPFVLAAAFVQMGIDARKLPPVEPLEMEAVVRLCEDRDGKAFPPPLKDAERDKKHDAWRRLLWKAKRLVPLIVKVTERADSEETTR